MTSLGDKVRVKPHDNRLMRNIAQAILNVAARPPELRGPWLFDEETLQAQAVIARKFLAETDSLDLSPPVVEEGAHHGYVFQNPDTGTEYSANHPVESGEVEDAYDIRLATYFEDHLVAELRNAKTTIGTLTESLNATSQNYSSAYTRAEAAEAKLRTVFAPVPEPQAVAWQNMWDRSIQTNEPPAAMLGNYIPLYAAPLSGGGKVEVTEEMVEAVARALAADELGMGDPYAVVETIVKHQWRAFERQARVALVAALSTMGGKP